MPDFILDVGPTHAEPTPLPESVQAEPGAPFPIDVLPRHLQAAAIEIARFVKTPVESPAIAGLSVAATAISKHARIQERPGLYHWPALFFALVADSGERKSPVFKAMTQPLEAWEQAQTETHAIDRRRTNAKNVAIDTAITAIKAKAKKGQSIDDLALAIEDLESSRVPVPPSPSLFTTDTTPERLFQKMHDRDGAYAVLSGEGRPVVDAILGRDGRTGDAIYLSGISGDTITRDRVGGGDGPEERVIRNPCLNVCIFIQPGKYAEMAGNAALQDSGAIARILPVLLSSQVGRRIEAAGEAGLRQAAMQPYWSAIGGLLTRHKHDSAHLAVLSADAQEDRREHHNLVEAMLAPGGDLDDCRALGAKATTQAVKLALLFHLLDDPSHLDDEKSIVSLETWKRARALGMWLLQEAVRVHRSAQEDPILAGARRVLAWLHSRNMTTVKAANLMQTGPRPRPKAREAAAILDLLADYGHIEPVSDPQARSPVFRLISHFSQFSQGQR